MSLSTAHHLFDKMSIHPEATSSCVLQITITNLIYQVTEEVLDRLFDVYGVHDVCISHKSTHMEVFVEFQSWLEASQARGALHGRCIYDGCCLLDIQHAPSSISVNRLPNSKTVVVDFDCVEMAPPALVHAAVQGASSPPINELCGDAQASIDVALVDHCQGGEVVMLTATTIAQNSSGKEAHLGDHQMNMSDDIKQQLGAVTGMMEQLGSVPNQAGSRLEPWLSFPSITLLDCSYETDFPLFLKLGVDVRRKWDPGIMLVVNTHSEEFGFNYTSWIQWDPRILNFVPTTCLCRQHQRSIQLAVLMTLSAIRWDPGILSIPMRCESSLGNVAHMVEPLSEGYASTKVLPFTRS